MYSKITVNGVEYEYTTDAAAGVSLANVAGGRWWGTRFRFRAVGTRRWNSFTAVDLHPFDVAGVHETIDLYLRAGSE